jgi:phosphate acyltransferase
MGQTAREDDQPGGAPQAAKRPTTIALDAFGGDACPGAEVEGAVQAARGGVHVILVGHEEKLRKALRPYRDHESLPIRIHHASQTIEMADSPSKAVRNKPDASMPVAFDLVKRGEADAAMSAGNSGAMLACGLFKYRRIRGVDRPPLVTSLPTRTGMAVVLDVGANVECRPLNLVQFAVLGAVYACFKHGKSRPTVGILSNGTEASKGTELTRAAHRVLSEHGSEDFEFAGYVEGDRVFGGGVDVVVTDGFTGNVALKLIEATGRLIGRWLREAIDRGMRQKIGALLMKSAFDELKHRMDPDTYGAAPLLGVGGVAFICHGGSSPFAIATALRLSARSVDEDLLPKLADAIARNKPLFEAAKGIEEHVALVEPAATLQEGSS